MNALSALLFILVLQDAKAELYKLIREGAGVDKIRPLLESDATLAKARADLEETPLHDASRFSKLEVVKLLIEKGADVNRL